MINKSVQSHRINQFKSFKSFKLLPHHPFPLFAYLEWILLSICLLIEFRILHLKPPFILEREILNPVLVITALLLFGIMGLRLPKNKLLNKFVYTFSGLILMLLANYGLGKGIGFTPTFLLVIVIRSCLVFNLHGRLLVAGLSWIYFILNLNINRPLNLANKPPILNAEILKDIVLNLQVTAAVLFSFILLFVLLLVNAVISERENKQKLVLAHEQLRQYVLRIEDQATLQERSRIAREIHDSIGHSLTAQSIQLENALLFVDSNIDKAKSFLVQGKNMGANALKEVRFSVSALRSDPLKGKSLEFAIKDLFQEFQLQFKNQPKFDLQVNQILSPEVKLAIYRIIQEALTNISKHSDADSVIIEIKTIDNSLYLNIQDNGVGFNPKQNTTGFGLQSMRDRANALGGKFYLNSKPREGCSIMMFLPLSGLD
ncbi:histidine kinase [Calothrix parasitica NIES-267]|uniref:Oxygen sensor histidine kinase NreB n=1 Tax=Calothrix parasitica NIES-267 TaxID=1973488 RepID=A0A1Z4M268_9CYAN|nr:histidine kinase [Calothrix parasitica NIES-267]